MTLTITTRYNKQLTTNNTNNASIDQQKHTKTNKEQKQAAQQEKEKTKQTETKTTTQTQNNKKIQKKSALGLQPAAGVSSQAEATDFLKLEEGASGQSGMRRFPNRLVSICRIQIRIIWFENLGLLLDVVDLFFCY